MLNTAQEIMDFNFFSIHPGCKKARIKPWLLLGEIVRLLWGGGKKKSVKKKKKMKSNNPIFIIWKS